jgi:hypothetical protein
MKELIASPIFKAVLSSIVIVVILDELALFWWKKLNPGAAQWSTITKRQPLQHWDGFGTDYPNGYRPAGGI